MNKLDYNLNWGESFKIDKESPSNLLRINSNNTYYPVGYQEFQKNLKPAGWRLRFQTKLYLVHRIIWVMTYGSIDPELVIDHLDGDPFNNQITNLSLKTSKDNARNKRKFINNKTGVTGVMKDIKGSYSYYKATWNDINGARKSKCFSVNKFGEELAKLLAVEYRDFQMKGLISEGAAYTERHGN